VQLISSIAFSISKEEFLIIIFAKMSVGALIYQVYKCLKIKVLQD
jgi:hypothetical protein